MHSLQVVCVVRLLYPCCGCAGGVAAGSGRYYCTSGQLLTTLGCDVLVTTLQFKGAGIQGAHLWAQRAMYLIPSPSPCHGMTVSQQQLAQQLALYSAMV
jgi:hypothetical protein